MSSSSFPDAGRSGPLDSDVAVGLLQRGQALAEQGDWDLAAGTFARVVGNADPATHTAALLGLAECRYRLDDEPAALQAWLTATQAPENEFTWRAWKALAAARVRENDVPGAARAYREAGRRAPASEQAEIQSRVGWLSKEMGDDRGAERAFSRTRADGLPQPVVTYAILAVTTVISLIALFGAGSQLEGSAELESWLLLDKGAVYYGGEYWRLLTVALVHGSIIHLGFNMYALWIIGPIVEALYGPRRFLAIYLICVAAGSVASYATSANPAVGASGGVFGLFGALIVADRVHKPALTRNARNLTMQIGMLIVINLVIGVTIPGIDNAAHVGGLLAGAALGFLLVPQGARLDSFWTRPANGATSPDGEASDPVRRTRGLRYAGIAALIGAILVVVAIGPVTYKPPLWWLVAGQPGSSAEPLGDAVAVAAGAPNIDGGDRLTRGRAERQLDDQGTTWFSVRALVTEQQAQPHSHAAAQLQSAIDRATRDAIGPAERIAG
jgi:rhomboid protease GluP